MGGVPILPLPLLILYKSGEEVFQPRGISAQGKFAFRKAKMNAFFCLSIACAMLAVCHGVCFTEKHKAVLQDDELVLLNFCVDKYDGRKHPIGDKWNTAECFKCTCGSSAMECCTRYGGVAHVKGCRAKVDEKTCAYKFFKANDPSKPCF